MTTRQPDATTSRNGAAAAGSRLHVQRSRGAISGVLLVLLGLWGALIPFVGPSFDYAYTPDTSWDFTWGRFWLEVVPGAGAAIGGLMLIGSAHRVALLFGGWLAALSGAWLVVGQQISLLWRDAPWAGEPTGSLTRAVWEQIGFFSGLGVVVVFFGALALGRMTVVGARDLAASRTQAGYDDEATSTTSDREDVRGDTPDSRYARNDTIDEPAESSTATQE
jgi:hypothetical protein